MYIPNGDRVFQPFPFQGPPKVAQIMNFCLKIYHLATLQREDIFEKKDCEEKKQVHVLRT
jgi:hypothetical protein